jgi:hypothetical protein
MSELSPEARAFLRAHRDEGEPTAADAERVRAAVEASLATGAAGVGTAAALKKLSLVKAFVLAVGLGAVSTVAVRQVVAPAPKPVQSKPAPARAPTRAPIATSPAVAPAPVPATEPVPPAPAPAPAPMARPVAIAPRAPAVAPVVAATPSTPEPAPAQPPLVPVEAGAAPPRPSAARSQPPDELALVSRALTLLRNGHRLESLEVLRQWEEHFGERGQLKEEAHAARVVARCELGDADAGREAGLYLQHYPASVQRNRVERACRTIVRVP